MSFWNRRPKTANLFANIHDAVEAGDLANVEKFLNEGVAADAQDGRGATALHIAAARGHFEIAKVLIGEGADVNFLIVEGGTPLMAACSQTRPNLVQLLLMKGAEVNKKGHNGRSPLSCVFRPSVTLVHEQIECIRLLASYGVDLNGRTTDGGTPLMDAVWFGNREGVEELLALGADAALRDNVGKTAAMLAFERGFDDLAHLLKAHAK